MIVDAHAHAYEMIAGYGAKGECRALGNGRGIWATGEVEQFFPEQYGDLGFLGETLLNLMKETGVDHAVLLQGGNYGFHNDYAAELARKYPEKFTAVGTLDPYCLHAEKILERFIREYKFQSLKFEISESWGLTGYHPRMKLTGKEFAPILKRANEEEMTVVFDLGFMSNSSFDVESLRVLSKTYSKITFVITHCFFPAKDGKNDLRLEYIRQLKEDGFMFDISNLPEYYWVHPEEFLQEAFGIMGAERIMWGTDIPCTLKQFTYKQMLKRVADCGIFNEHELTLVFGENARRVYHII